VWWWVLTGSFSASFFAGLGTCKYAWVQRDHWSWENKFLGPPRRRSVLFSISELPDFESDLASMFCLSLEMSIYAFFFQW
jgi:hypothetical protein